MAKSDSDAVPFRITEDLPDEEKDAWREAEDLYEQRMKNAARRTENSEDSGLAAMVDAYAARGRRPSTFTGDLSGSAPATVIDGDIRADDPEHREDIDYIELMKSVLPRADGIRMATLDELARCTPFALINAQRHSVAMPLAPLNARLTALALSDTPHRDVAHFVDHVALEMGGLFLVQDGARVLISVYGTYGVTCLLDERTFVLRAHVFTETP